MTTIISLTGDLGSGKSTVSAILCAKLPYSYIYTGAIQRQIAERHGMTTTELNKYAETHPEIDAEIDATFKSLRNSSDLIVDSRLAWFFISNSFKVFLKTNLMISAKRISNDKKRKSENYATKEDAARNIIERKTSENKRYIELYGADCANPNNFNLIVDTSFNSPEQVAEIILREYAGWLTTGVCAKAFVSPKNLYPTRSVQDFDQDDYLHLLKSMEHNGFDPNYPVAAVQKNAFDYIIDGHMRTSCALKNSIDPIPVVYRQESGDSLSGTFFSEWENFHAVKFLMYPDK
ncbi:MAG: cytidylate kinase family protein [Bacteroidales bacterium]|jgi:cytidylate kinase|nr:cytidylate kinase family protein [Bacteroidales bacterium]